MSCGNCGKCRKSAKLCPLSFGLALGITSAIAVLIWSVWIMKFGVPVIPGHPPLPLPDLSAGAIAARAGWWLLKGFLFGLVLALIYDFIACCCKSRCCKKVEGTGTGAVCCCGNTSCNCDCGNKPKI